MAKQKTKTEAEPVKIQTQETDSAGFETLSDLFHVHEDNYNEHQDAPLLALIESENSVNDKVKIKFLFKKYRDEARDNHGC
jgi:hypothetical protein